MILLALETTDIRASVALYRNGAVKEKCIESPLRHEETVMPAVAALLEDDSPDDKERARRVVGDG